MSQSQKPLGLKPADPPRKLEMRPDWLTAQAKAATTARPAKPRVAYKRRWKGRETPGA